MGIATKWGSATLMSSFFLYYLELCNNGEHSTMATVFVILENLILIIAKAFLGKLDMTAQFDKAPGRYRHLVVLYNQYANFADEYTQRQGIET